MSQVSFDTLPKIAPHVSYAVVTVKDYGKRAKSHGDLLQAALALFPNSEKGGVVTHVDGGSNIRHAGLRHA
jgi:hypothetical protein